VKEINQIKKIIYPKSDKLSLTPLGSLAHTLR
jgi:hypothetical protein